MYLLPQDKLMHYFVGSLITTTFVPLIGTYAIIPTIIAAIGKEVYDKVSGTGTPELLDIVYTVAGGLPIVVGVIAST